MASQDANQIVEDVAKLRRRMVITHSKADLTHQEKESFLTLLCLRSALEADLLGTPYIQTSWRRRLLSINSIELEAYFKAWKTLELLFMEFEAIGCRDWLRFKRAARIEIQYNWIVAAFEPFFQLKSDVVRVALSRQWLVFDSRYTIDSVDRRTELCEEYRRFEESLESYAYDVSDESEVVEGWFSKHAPAVFDFKPKHGPGATRETQRGVPPIVKYCEMRIDPGVVNLFRQHLFRDMSDYLPVSTRSTCVTEGKLSAWTTDDTWRTCDLVFVPKSALTNRLISKEPATLQYLQQGIKEMFVDIFSLEPTLRVDLFDAGKSARMALEGSTDGEYATIDLSNASDSVTLALVKALFEGTPWLAPLLLTRSTYVELGDGKSPIKMSKFAPMGSALCFPVECVVFASICEAEIRAVTGRPSRPGDYQVYGDDIVVRRCYTDGVLRRLHKHHFSVNARKSFHGNFLFREACGMEAYRGHDITPIRLSRGMAGLPLSPEIALAERRYTASQIAGWIDLANRFYRAGWTTCRRMLLYLLSREAWYGSVYRIGASRFMREDPPCEPYLITDDDTDTQYRCRMRYNSSLHRAEVRVLTIRSQSEDWGFANMEGLRLLDWHVRLSHTSGDEAPRESRIAEAVKPATLKWSWVPVT